MKVWPDIVYTLQLYKVLATFCGTLLIANIFGYVVMIAPVQSSISKLEDEMAALAAQRVEVQIQKQAQSDLIRFEELLFDQTGFEQLMSDLSKTAKQQGMGIPTLNYSPQGDQNKGISRLQVGLNFHGSYPKIKRILGKLEDERRLLILDELSLSKARTGDSLQANLSLEVYLHGDG